MAGFLIPLAGLALGALGRLANRRKQARAGASFGSAINTQPQGPPTNSVSTAATSSPTPPSGGGTNLTPGFGQTSFSSRQRMEVDTGRGASVRQLLSTAATSGDSGGEQGRASALRAMDPAQRSREIERIRREHASSRGSKTSPDEGLAARMGAESVARSRKRNLQQQATLSGAAVTSR
jgi:hypothetical protein